MSKIHISGFLLVVAVCAYNTNADGVEGGVATTIQARPYIASLQGADGTLACAGTLINENTVVTVAECLQSSDVSQLFVGVNNGAQVIPIASYSINPNFDFDTMNGDIAVVKLAKSASAGVIKPATKQPVNGVNAVVTGWNANNDLVDIPVTVIDAEVCGSGKYKYDEDDILDTMLCGLPKNNQACGAISGSPVVANNELVGLVSWGYGCGNKGNPIVFADVPSLELWVAVAAKNL